MFTEEQQKAIDDMLAKQKQQLESDFEDKIGGLKSTNAAMKQEKLELAQKAEARTLELEQKAIDAAKEAGKFQEALDLERKQAERKIQELTAEVGEHRESRLSSEKKAAISKVSTHFAKNDRVSMNTANTLIDSGFDENGKVITKYMNWDGEVIADNEDSWLEWAKTDPDVSNYLVGTQASGTDYSTVKPSVKAESQEVDRQSKINEINSKFS